MKSPQARLPLALVNREKNEQLATRIPHCALVGCNFRTGCDRLTCGAVSVKTNVSFGVSIHVPLHVDGRDRVVAAYGQRQHTR
jgi:hypothetical protein